MSDAQFRLDHSAQFDDTAPQETLRRIEVRCCCNPGRLLG